MRPGQSGDELAPAHVHGEQDVADRNAPAQLLGMDERFGHSVTRQLAVCQPGGVLLAARGVGLAVEDHVVGEPHRLLGWEVAVRHGGQPVEQPVGALLPTPAWHHPIVAGGGTRRWVRASYGRPWLLECGNRDSAGWRRSIGLHPEVAKDEISGIFLRGAAGDLQDVRGRAVLNVVRVGLLARDLAHLAHLDAVDGCVTDIRG